MTRPRYPSDSKPRVRNNAPALKVTLEPDQLQRVKALAAERGVSVSALIREALERYLGK